MTVKEELNLFDFEKDKIKVVVNFSNVKGIKDRWEEEVDVKTDWEVFINHIYSEAEADSHTLFKAKDYGIFHYDYETEEDYNEAVTRAWREHGDEYAINVEIEGFRYYLKGYSWYAVVPLNKKRRGVI